MQGSPLWKYLRTAALVRYLLLFACGWAAIEVLGLFSDGSGGVFLFYHFGVFVELPGSLDQSIFTS